MKKIFASLAAVLVSVAMSAQIYVGGGLNFSDKYNGGEAGIKLSPEVGYVLNENLAIGGVLDFEVADFGAFDEFNLDIAPYARYTFYKAGNFSIFADGSVDFNYNGGASEFTWKGVFVKPGVSYAINEKFSLAAHMGQIGYDDIKGAFEVAPNSKELKFSLYYNF